MWLINTSSYELREASPEDKTMRYYAILSHRWRDDEVTFNHVRDHNFKVSATPRTKGWLKIEQFCKLAAARSIKWAWIDTCCIDKTSSAELSEAVNSMFRWYQKAVSCVVYMYDVTDDQASFEKSDWFTRGWTLQELLAPRDIEFYDRDWTYIGTRNSLCKQISSSTNIPLPILYDPSIYSFRKYSVAQRMSWAAQRHTTRPEDAAYSLLGLFDVHMPLLYGEGAMNAFYRLQLQILQESDDETLFCWKQTFTRREVLAPELECFSSCGNIKVSRTRIPRRPYFMTNRGLQIELDLYDRPALYIDPKPASCYYAPLNCVQEDQKLVLVLYWFNEDEGEEEAEQRVEQIPHRDEETGNSSTSKRVFYRQAIHLQPADLSHHESFRSTILIASERRNRHDFSDRDGPRHLRNSTADGSPTMATVLAYNNVVSDIHEELLDIPSTQYQHDIFVLEIRFQSVVTLYLEEIETPHFKSTAADILARLKRINFAPHLLVSYANICKEVIEMQDKLRKVQALRRRPLKLLELLSTTGGL